MKQNVRWAPSHRFNRNPLINDMIPTCLKVPAEGKYIVYISGVDSLLLRAYRGWLASTADNEESERMSFENNVHMISSIELIRPTTCLNIADNTKSIIVLWNERLHHVYKDEISNWLFCSVSERLKGYHIALTGAGRLFPKQTYKNLIQLNGGEYHDKVNSKTNLVINCSAVPTKTLSYAKKHDIKKITETEFFKFLA